MTAPTSLTGAVIALAAYLEAHPQLAVPYFAQVSSDDVRLQLSVTANRDALVAWAVTLTGPTVTVHDQRGELGDWFIHAVGTLSGLPADVWIASPAADGETADSVASAITAAIVAATAVPPMITPTVGQAPPPPPQTVPPTAPAAPGGAA